MIIHSLLPARAGRAVAIVAQTMAAADVPVEKVHPIHRRRDTLELSPRALELAGVQAEDEPLNATGEVLAGDDTEAPEEGSASSLRGADGEALTQEEETQVRELQGRDREVRAHEEAHKAAAGDLAIGAPTYEYEQAPDGRKYAVGGEVQIALKPGRTPEETARNAQRARRAALAPAEPSAQDHKVAAEAAQMEAEARQEARKGETDARTEGPGRASDPARGDLLRRDEAYRAIAGRGDARPSLPAVGTSAPVSSG